MLAALFLSGCGTASQGNDEAAISGVQEESAGLDFRSSIPKTEQASHIRPDPAGYAKDDVKEAIFTGKDLADTFWVVDANSRKRAYQGKLKAYKNPSVSENEIWIGEFTELTKEGAYYIETPVIGQSEIFEIRNDTGSVMYDPAALWKEQIAGITDLQDADKADRALNSLFVMGMAAELYPQQTQDILLLLTQETDRLTEMTANEESAENSEEQICILSDSICVLAQTASLPDLEKETAALFSKRAVELYRQLQKKAGSGDADQGGLERAGAALFKLTGEKRYGEAAEKRLSEIDGIPSTQFITAWFYLTAKGRVDTDLCSSLINKLIVECGDIPDAMDREVMPYELSDLSEYDEKMFEVRLLSLADYVLVSREYEIAKNRRLHRLSLSGMDPSMIADPLLSAGLYLAGF